MYKICGINYKHKIVNNYYNKMKIKIPTNFANFY